MREARIGGPARHAGRQRPRGRTVGLAVLALSWAVPLKAQLAPCAGNSDVQGITESLTRIERSIDPCGESAQIGALLEQLHRCSANTYQICTDRDADRNVFDRPVEQVGEALPRTITWNPELRSELEPDCDGDRTRPLLRDPTASLLHELVHAVQDCVGLNPGEHELEAVQMENIYRRSAGLCQRRSYGDQPLPAAMVKVCGGKACPCTPPTDAVRVRTADAQNPRATIFRTTTHSTQVGDSAPVPLKVSTGLAP